jgi:hypothetical protein
MHWIKENWFKVIILILIITGFYWFSYSPTKIRIKCENIAQLFSPENHDLNYFACVRDHGLLK